MGGGGSHQEFSKLRSLPVTPERDFRGAGPASGAPWRQSNQVTSRPRVKPRLPGRPRGNPGGSPTRRGARPLRLGSPPGRPGPKTVSSLVPSFPRRPGCAQRRHLNRPLGTAAWRGRKGGGGLGAAAGPGRAGLRSGSGPGGHSPARVVVEVLQHRVAEEGPGRTLEAHWALRVQVVGARRGPCSHQRQEQRAEPPGAPLRRRAAHPQLAAALP